MRGVRPQEVDELAAELRQRYLSNNCPYEVASQDAGWVMRLRPAFRQFGTVIEVANAAGAARCRVAGGAGGGGMESAGGPRPPR